MRTYSSVTIYFSSTKLCLNYSRVHKFQNVGKKAPKFESAHKTFEASAKCMDVVHKTLVSTGKRGLS